MSLQLVEPFHNGKLSQFPQSQHLAISTLTDAAIQLGQPCPDTKAGCDKYCEKDKSVKLEIDIQYIWYMKEKKHQRSS